MEQATSPLPPWADARAKEISALLFDDKWVQWAWMSVGKGKKKLIRLREMAAEHGHELLYDRWYFDMSQFIHSAPASVIGSTEGKRHFQIDTSASDKFLSRSVTLGNLFVWSALTVADVRFKLGAEFPLKEAQFRTFKFSDDPDLTDGVVEHLMQEYRMRRAAESSRNFPHAGNTR